MKPVVHSNSKQVFFCIMHARNGMGLLFAG